MKKALIILRVSDQYQEERHSLDKQEEQALSYCGFKGYTVYKVLKTVVSGRKNDRVDFQELEKEIEKNSFDVLVFYELSRLARNAYFIHKLIHALRQKEIEFESITESYLNSDSPTSKMMLGIMASQAEIESDLISKRVKNRMKFYASQGYHLFPPPLGYDLKEKILYPNKEAEKVRDVFRDFINGYSFRKLQEKYKISHPGLKRLLTNTTYLGKVKFGFEGRNLNTGKREKDLDGEIFEGKHEAIIDEDTFLLAQKIVNERSRKILKVHVNQNILSGILFYLDNKMYGKRNSKTGYRLYTCRKTSKSISATRIEKIVIGALIDYANSIELPQHKMAAQKEDKQKSRIKALESKKNRIIDTYADGFITREEYLKRVKVIEDEVKKLSEVKLDKKIQELSLKEKLLDQLKHLEKKNNVVQKQLTQLLIERVTLDEEGNIDIAFKL